MEEEYPTNRSTNSKTFLNQYIHENPTKKLGEGTYGQVYRMIDQRKKVTVALKKIKLDNQEDEGIPSTSIREICVLKQLKHQNIVELIDQNYSVIEKRLYLVFEYMEYDLRKFLDKKFPLQQQQIKQIIQQILCGLQYCHSRSILHRDIKPQNILINEKNQVKLADFGLSRSFQFPMPKFTKEIATLWYRAPEIMFGDDCYGTGLDIWSTGCIMVELFTGKPLFIGDSQIDTLFKIMQILGTPTEQTYSGLTKLPEYILNIPKFKPQNLQTLFPIIDPLGIDLITKMLAFNPSQRLEAKDLLQHQWFDSIKNSK